jgi:hypothetical protein
MPVSYVNGIAAIAQFVSSDRRGPTPDATTSIGPIDRLTPIARRGKAIGLGGAPPVAM